MKAVLERFQQDLNAKHGTSTGMSRLPDEWEGKKVLPIIKSDSSRLEDTYYCKTLDYAPSNMDEEHEEGCYMRIMIVPCGAGSLDASAAVEQVLQYVKPNEPQAVIMIGMGGKNVFGIVSLFQELFYSLCHSWNRAQCPAKRRGTE